MSPPEAFVGGLVAARAVAGLLDRVHRALLELGDGLGLAALDPERGLAVLERDVPVRAAHGAPAERRRDRHLELVVGVLRVALERLGDDHVAVLGLLVGAVEEVALGVGRARGEVDLALNLLPAEGRVVLLTARVVARGGRVLDEAVLAVLLGEVRDFEHTVVTCCVDCGPGVSVPRALLWHTPLEAELGALDHGARCLVELEQLSNGRFLRRRLAGCGLEGRR